MDANHNEKFYKEWVDAGWITATPGEMIDFRLIRDEIIKIQTDFDIVELAYDPAQATMLITDLIDEGVECVEIRPTTINFSEPMKYLDGLIRSGYIRHNSDPVMSWMVGNVVARPNAKDEVYPRKERDENKIDGVVALLQALGRAHVPAYDHDGNISDMVKIKL
jgi:phage terminase large subunit-like protein